MRSRSGVTRKLAAGAMLLAFSMFMAAAGAVSARAADHPLDGTRLTARSNGSKELFVWVSRAPEAVFPTVSPVLTGATLQVSASDGDTVTVALGGSYWRETSAGVRARYLNRQAPAGDSVCRLSVLADAKLVKVVCRDDLIDTLDVGPEGIVTAELSVGTDRYCASFGGVVRDEQGAFKAKRAPAPVSCGGVQTTTTSSVTLTSCPTTTTIAECGEHCGVLAQCPPPQLCTDDGMGQCGCEGPPVPCGDAGHPQLCQFGACPAGMECRPLLYLPPDCPLGCVCQ